MPYNFLILRGIYAKGICDCAFFSCQCEVEVQQQIQKAKEFIANKVQMVKNYVNDLKQKAIAAVKSYATQIINDITSKIKLNIGGALGF